MAKKRKNTALSQSEIRAWIASQPPSRRRDLRSALSSLKKEFDARDSKDLLWWHRVGSLVAEFFAEGGREYGSNVTELLAAELGADDDAAVRRVSNTLWQARKIFNVLATKREAKSWAKKRNSEGRPLSAYHIFAVAAIDDTEQRNDLLKQCLAESWSVKQLQAEVQSLFGGRRSSGGRKAGKRSTPHPAVALKEIQVAAAHWMADHKVWFAGRKSALGHVAKKQRTDGFNEVELGLAIDALAEMQETVGAGIECLERLADEIEANR